jgi:catechol 2,3-dioxygenase-like lactoylglutathione lyase family enzyme
MKLFRYTQSVRGNLVMGVRYIEHILIMTDQPEKTRDWWRDTLGLAEGETPKFGFPVYWLFAGKIDVIHIAQPHYSKHQDAYIGAPDKTKKHISSYAGYEATGSGRIDHVCLNCENLQEFIDRLQRTGVEFIERQAYEGRLYQLFMVEPINGIKVELNFAAAEAEKLGRKAPYGAKGAVKDAAAAK